MLPTFLLLVATSALEEDTRVLNSHGSIYMSIYHLLVKLHLMYCCWGDDVIIYAFSKQYHR